jgi:hypothetical protein
LPQADLPSKESYRRSLRDVMWRICIKQRLWNSNALADKHVSTEIIVYNWIQQWEAVFSTRSVPGCYKQDKSRFSQSRVVAEARDSSGTQRKGNVCR